MLVRSSWKIRREVVRIGRQLKELPLEIARKIYFLRWYDSLKLKEIRRTYGDIPFGPEVGICVLYPRNGLMASHIHMLRELKQEKISPVVVSNLPLTDVERSSLIPNVTLLLERPNIGYDFGGYRDAILDKDLDLQGIDKLWILNDSAWLVPQQKSWFNAARALETDFMAATSNFGIPRIPAENFRDISWTFRRDHKNFHYASYALGFSQRILRDPRFLEYWKKLEIRNDKRRTVRRGEIGLSHWVLNSGYTHGETFSVVDLKQSLESLTDAELESITIDLVIPEDTKLQALKQEITSDKQLTRGRRHDLISFILTCVARQGPAYVLPAYSLPRGFHFLKKSPIILSKDSSEASMRIISRIDETDREIIQVEAEQLLEQGQQKEMNSPNAKTRIK